MKVSDCNMIEERSCNFTVAFEMLCEKHAVKLRLTTCIADIFFRLNYWTIILYCIIIRSV